MKIIFFDTETTSLNPGNICQLSYIMVEDGKVSGKNFFFTVDSMSPFAERVHHLSMAKLQKLSGNRRFEDFIDEIEEDFNGADILVGHNVSFDIRFLDSEFLRCGRSLKYGRSFCTMGHCTKKFGRKLKLEVMLDSLEVNREEILRKSRELFASDGVGFHDARFDITGTYLAVLKEAENGASGDIIFSSLG